MVGEGIDGLLGLVVRLFIEPGTPVVTSLGAYPTFNFHVAGFGGRLVTVPYRDDREDPHGAARRGAPRERAAGLSRQSRQSDGHLVGRRRRSPASSTALPDDTLLLLDEAYGEFAPAGRRARARPRRSATCCGCAPSPRPTGSPASASATPSARRALIKAFDKIRNHFGVNRIGQAGALAALGDPAIVAWVRGEVAAARARIAAIAARNGLSPLPSATNFVTIDCGGDGAFARRVLEELIARDVFVRMPGVAPLDRCIRVGCGARARSRASSKTAPTPS